MTLLYSPWWLLEFLLCLLILRGLFSLFLRIAKEQSAGIDTLKRLQEKEKTVNRLTKIAVFGFACFSGGWMLRDSMQFHHTYVINDLRVVQKHTAQEFTLAFEDTHQPFNATFCSDYVPQFDSGMTLKVLVYEDRGSCWSISDKKLGYIIARDENGRAQIKGE